jgi:DNA repair exonuclease SbcCD ATPase subunit
VGIKNKFLIKKTQFLFFLKYLSFLERIGNILKISQISADVGLDMNVDIILARVEQLVRSESDSLQDKQTNIYNLQRKVKSYKEQLDNKELHLDLLRKKLAALEEERAGKCALEREVDDHITMSKKFKLKVEKLTEQLSAIKQENNELKSQLLDSGCLKVCIYII